MSAAAEVKNDALNSSASTIAGVSSVHSCRRREQRAARPARRTARRPGRCRCPSRRRHRGRGSRPAPWSALKNGTISSQVAGASTPAFCGQVGAVDERVGVGVPGHRVGDAVDHAGGPRAREEASGRRGRREPARSAAVEELRLRLGGRTGRRRAPCRPRSPTGAWCSSRRREHRDLKVEVGVRRLEGLDDLVGEHVRIALGGPDSDGACGRGVVDGSGRAGRFRIGPPAARKGRASRMR